MKRHTGIWMMGILLCLALLAGCGKQTPAPSAVPTAETAPTATELPAETPQPSETPAVTENPDTPDSPAASQTPQTPRPTPGIDDPREGPEWVELPEEGRWLSDRELAEWGAWFSADFMRDQFLYSTYHTPRDIDLMQTFYNGGVGDQLVDMMDVRAFLLRYGTWNPFTDVLKLSREDIDETLKDYTGLTLEEMNGVGLYMLSYVPETHCYYTFRGDTNRQADPVFEYGWQEGDRVALYYEGSCVGDSRYLNGLFRVTLELTPGDWRFRANEFCEMKNDVVTYVAEPDPWFPEQEETRVDLSSPEADPGLSAPDMAAARENILALLTEGTAHDIGEEYSFMVSTYDCICGKEGENSAVFFLGSDGTVIRLPVREDVPTDEIWVQMSDLILQYTWTDAEEDRGCNYSFLIPTGELFISEFSW